MQLLRGMVGDRWEVLAQSVLGLPPPGWIVRFYNTQELLSGSLGTCNLLRYSNMALLDGYATARVHKMPTQNATPFNIKEPFQVPIRFLKQ